MAVELLTLGSIASFGQMARQRPQPTHLLWSMCALPFSMTGPSWAQMRAQEMGWERLPDLAVPRSGHALLYLNGELTVLGGHTTGFIPTPTAEYFKDGAWHTVSTLYSHDLGFCLPLKDGNVLLGGGLPEPFGVGQSFSAELYTPLSHTFDPVTILDRKRAAANAVELENGTIPVSGNWYADDALELYSASSGFAYVKETAEQRALYL